MVKTKHVILILILIFLAWLLWPRANDNASNKIDKSFSERDEVGKDKRKYIIKVTGGGYMPGTMPANVGEPLNALTRVKENFEALYPDTCIKYVNVPSYVREWLVTQLFAGQAPDILIIDVEDVWQDAHKGWYIPLDEFLVQPNPFVPEGAPGSKQWWDIFKYQAISRGKAGPDRKMYCICLDMVETGIFYNKDIFGKLSLSPPKDWIEFVDIMTKLREVGYIPILTKMHYQYDWLVDLVFDQLYYDLLPGIDLIKDPVREAYLQGYLDGSEISFLFKKGFFTRRDPRWLELWRIVKEFRQFSNRDISGYADPKLFITQKSAMFWSSSGDVQKMAKDPDIEFNWGVFYLPPIPEQFSRFASGHGMCVIGGAATQYVVTNTAISDTKNIATSERLKRCIAFLQFLTTPDNAGSVVNEVMASLPNVKGTTPHKQLLPFDGFLQRRYATTKWFFTFDLRFNEIYYRMLELYLNDGIGLDEYMDWMEKSFVSAIETMTRRKKLDFVEMERKWQELAVLRESMEGLPDAAR